MNADVLKGAWKEMKGDVKSRWGRLTDDDLLEVEGEEEKFIGLLQRKYGYARDRAEEEYRDFVAGLGKRSGRERM